MRRSSACICRIRSAMSSVCRAAHSAGRCDAAIERIAKEEAGVVVLLRDQESSRDFMDAVECWL